MEENQIIEPTQEQKTLSGKAIRSLVFGILSVAVSRTIGLVFGILALTQGNGAARFAERNGLPLDGRAKAGRILGIVGIVVSSLALVWGLVKFSGFLAALIASIRSGSLGLFGDYFQDLGQSISGTGL